MNDPQQPDDRQHPHEQAYIDGRYWPTRDTRVEAVVELIVPLMNLVRDEVATQQRFYDGRVSHDALKQQRAEAASAQSQLQRSIYDLAETLEGGR